MNSMPETVRAFPTRWTWSRSYPLPYLDEAGEHFDREQHREYPEHWVKTPSPEIHLHRNPGIDQQARPDQPRIRDGQRVPHHREDDHHAVEKDVQPARPGARVACMNQSHRAEGHHHLIRHSVSKGSPVGRSTGESCQRTVPAAVGEQNVASKTDEQTIKTLARRRFHVSVSNRETIKNR